MIQNLRTLGGKPLLRKPLAAGSVLIASMLLGVAPSYAAGRGDTPLVDAKGLRNWEQNFDISDKKPGTYNLVVEGRDLAGNVTIAGPINVYVDPKSDLPIAVISNPLAGMRVGGDLNIVGTCVDDDSVGRVELKIDDGEWLETDGKEFWSWYLKGSSIEDGRRTLRVRGVDVNGLTGPESVLSFDMDRHAPLGTTESPAIGTLVSGEIRLRGNVYDANGVDSVEYSLDGGRTFTAAKGSLDKKTGNRSVNAPIDTKELPDGPTVIWLRSVDGVGSTGLTPILLVIDNTKPEIELAFPGPEDKVDADFSFFGLSRDTVGIKALSWRIGDLGGEIPLQAGDPFWTVPVSLPVAKGKSAELIITAVDTIGNTSERRFRLTLDLEADKPKTTVLSPQPADRTEGKVFLAGFARDDDGVAAMEYWVDKAAPQRVETSGAFAVDIKGLAPGKRQISVRAIDTKGKAGNTVLVPIEDLGAAPKLGLAELVLAAGSKDARTEPFTPGMEIAPDSGAALRVAVAGGAKFAAFDWKLSGPGGEGGVSGTIKPKSGEDPGFLVPLPPNMPFGFVEFLATAKDLWGRSAEVSSFAYITDYSTVRGDPAFVFADERLDEAGTFRFVANSGKAGAAIGKPEPLRGRFVGATLASVELDPPNPAFKASFEGPLVTVEALAEAVVDRIVLVARTDRGHEFRSGEYRFEYDAAGPKIAFDDVTSNIIGSSLTLAGRVVDPNGISFLGLSVSAGPASAPLDVESRELLAGSAAGTGPEFDSATGRFESVVTLSSVPDGLIRVSMNAKDSAGNEASATLEYLKDTQGPVLEFVLPTEGNFVPLAAGTLRDPSGIAQFSFAADGQNFIDMDPRSAFVQPIAGDASKARFRVVDFAGNSTLVGLPGVKAEPAQAPVGDTVPDRDIAAAPDAGEAATLELMAGDVAEVAVSVEAQPDLGASVATVESETPPSDSGTEAGAPLTEGFGTADTPSVGEAPVAAEPVGGAVVEGQSSEGSVPEAASQDLAFEVEREALTAQVPGTEPAPVAPPVATTVAAPVAPAASPAAVDPKAVPMVTILSPTGSGKVQGAVILAFRIVSPRPLALISWTFGSKSGTMAAENLVPADAVSAVNAGGTFVGAVVVESVAAKAGPVSATVSVKDSASKSGSATLKLSADPAGALPVLNVVSPVEAAVTDPSFPLMLEAVSPWGIASYQLTLDGGETRTVKSAGSASFYLEALSPGAHSAIVGVIDSFGRESAPIKRSFRVIGGDPEIRVDSFSRKDSREAFLPGAVLALGLGTVSGASGVNLEGTIRAPNGLVSAEVSVAGAPPVKLGFKKGRANEYAFSLPLPANLPSGRSDFTVRAKSAVGGEAVYTSFFYRVAPVPETGLFTQEGLYIRDSRIAAAGDSVAGDSVPVPRLLFTDDAGASFRFVGRPIESVSFSAPSTTVALSFDGPLVKLSPKADGMGESLMLAVKTVDGDEFTWGPAQYIVDRSPPVLEVLAPKTDAWLGNSAVFTLRLSGGVGIPAGTYSVNGVEAGVPVIERAEDGSFTGAIPLDVADGALLLGFHVRDEAGRTSSVIRVVNKDTVAPEGIVTIPRADDTVNGHTSIGARFTDEGAVASIEFSTDGAVWERAESLSAMSRRVDFAALGGTAMLPGAGVLFRASDLAGNLGQAIPAFTIKTESDKPRVVIQLPQEGETLRADFSISGAAFDDDAPAAVSYRMDGGEWVRIPLEANGFYVPVALVDIVDNEHLVEVFAEDMYGVIGETSSRTFRVSKEEPKGVFLHPLLDQTSSGIVNISGTASDANGIARVELSFDNAVTFNLAEGTTDWSYTLDTTILKDGLHSIYIRPKDAYETEGFYASLISVDNSPPALSLDLPLDGSISSGRLILSGRSDDARGLASREALVYRIKENTERFERRFDLGLDPVIDTVLAIDDLEDGEYGLRISARDKAGNETIMSRDFLFRAGWQEEGISLAAPVNGEKLAGRVRVHGRLVSPVPISMVTVYLDGKDTTSAIPDRNGWFSVDLDEEVLLAGLRTIEARFTTNDSRVLSSEKIEIEFRPSGGWVLADSFTPGSWIPERPFLSGTAGWISADEAASSLPAGAMRKAESDAARGHELESVEVSLDNGRTFQEAAGTKKWRFRLETQDYPAGLFPAVIRARFRNGESAVSRLILNLDKTPPVVSIMSPVEGGRFNEKLAVSGTAKDDKELVSVRLALRDGDKAGYELPSFIQGLYLDAHYFGEPVMEVGAGLTFFDDNVKLQFAYGYTPAIFMGQDRGRFHGSVFSAKLLANILAFPFAFWLGPDWDFLSANLAVGANFSYFSETQTTSVAQEESSSGIVIGAVLGQFEFPKISLKRLSIFRSYSFYVEGQAWFVSAELDGGIKPGITLGVRTSVF